MTLGETLLSLKKKSESFCSPTGAEKRQMMQSGELPEPATGRNNSETSCS